MENLAAFKPISVKSMIAKKNKKTADRIPKFIYNWLTKILHIDEINGLIKKYGHFHGTDFADALLEDFNVKVEIRGAENIPKEGRFIFASNHPLGGFDGILIMSRISKFTKSKVKFLVNDFLMYIYPLQEIFLPINKMGGQAKESARKIDEVYESDQQILIFPAGLCSRKKHKTIKDLAWNKHFIQRAIKNKRDIIPIHISGRNSNWFYNLSNFRKRLGIKFNLEMLYLSDEMFKQRGNSFTITIGKPIPYTTFNKNRTHKDWAEWVESKVYDMVQ